MRGFEHLKLAPLRNYSTAELVGETESLFSFLSDMENMHWY